jgi:hypothetical protein
MDLGLNDISLARDQEFLPTLDERRSFQDTLDPYTLFTASRISQLTNQILGYLRCTFEDRDLVLFEHKGREEVKKISAKHTTRNEAWN